jgi:phosphopantetheinyl transferase
MFRRQGNLATFPTLSTNDVHLWLIDLGEGIDHITTLEGYLDPVEQKKADPRFRVCRGALRDLLGKYLGMPPQQIRMNYTKNGKPYIESELGFSVSHKEHFAIIALTRSGPVGVDLEYKRPITALMSLCQRFLSQSECDILHNLGQEDRLKQFYEIWVKKEAYTKLIGGQLLKVLTELRKDAEQQKICDGWFQDVCWFDDNHLYGLACKNPLISSHHYWYAFP